MASVIIIFHYTSLHSYPNRESGHSTKPSLTLPTLVSPGIAPCSRRPPLISENLDESFSSTSPVLLHEEFELQAISDKAIMKDTEILSIPDHTEEFKKVIVTKVGEMCMFHINKPSAPCNL